MRYFIHPRATIETRHQTLVYIVSKKFEISLLHTCIATVLHELLRISGGWQAPPPGECSKLDFVDFDLRINEYTPCPEKHPEHYRLSLEEGLTNFNNFGTNISGTTSIKCKLFLVILPPYPTSVTALPGKTKPTKYALK